MKQKKLLPGDRPITANEAYGMRQEIIKLLNGGSSGIDGTKNINKECGYPESVTLEDMDLLYKREGIAARVVNVMPNQTWGSGLEVLEGEEEEDTRFETQWKDLNTRFNIVSVLKRADILSGIGRFGVILIGFNDGKKLSDPVPGFDGITVTPAPGWDLANNKKDKKKGFLKNGKKLEITYLRTFSETSVKVESVNSDVSSPRFSLPEYYLIRFVAPKDETSQGVVSTFGKGLSIAEKRVHWSRIIHLADDRKSSETYGTPRMENVVNRLLDLRKVLGGSGEMFWKGGFPGFSFEMDEKSDATLDPEGVREEFFKYSNGLQRYLAIQGLTAKALSPQVADPMQHFLVNVKAICITKGFPVSVFLGGDGAAPSSPEERRAWSGTIKNRQESYAEPYILRPFIDRLIDLGVLAEPEDGPREYHAAWEDLDSPTNKEKSDIAVAETNALANYANAGVDTLVPPLEFFLYVMRYPMRIAKKLADAAEKQALDQLGGDDDTIDDEEGLDGQGQPSDEAGEAAKTGKGLPSRPPKLVEEGAKRSTDPVRKTTRRSDRVSSE